ncbi:MAG: sulfurtransferase [Deltaproteobacteria bacterium]|nr:sulfurtransferase [Deltaproteobacteria bacterium]
MIQWKKLFTPVASLGAEEAKQYIDGHAEGAYTLLDVRQPWEYEEDHLPGARLIPLAELNARAGELDKTKPTLVYCAIGGRSRVAAQLLNGLGFADLYNLAGGIKAYRGFKVSGPQELNLDLVRGDESPGEILVLAYGMEKALKIFYDTVQARTQDWDLAGLCAMLGHIEEKHQERLWAQYQAVAGEQPDRRKFDLETVALLLEGGFKLEEFLDRNQPWTKGVRDILELAMMLETQALDLYLRLARKLTAPASKDILYGIAEEEKGHLAALARLLDERRPAPTGQG